MSKNGFAMPASRDAIRTAADVWDIAVQAAKDGASSASEKAGQAFPAATTFPVTDGLHDVVSFSYGCVFPAVFVARSMSATNPIVTGMIDGARAATDWVDELKHREPAPSPRQSGAGRVQSESHREKVHAMRGHLAGVKECPAPMR